jgi:hypothetical protein
MEKLIGSMKQNKSSNLACLPGAHNCRISRTPIITTEIEEPGE